MPGRHITHVDEEGNVCQNASPARGACNTRRMTVFRWGPTKDTYKGSSAHGLKQVQNNHFFPTFTLNCLLPTNDVLFDTQHLLFQWVSNSTIIFKYIISIAMLLTQARQRIVRLPMTVDNAQLVDINL
jgi:hypothetical protein